jgi:iron complex outermembrane receptor protein
MPEVTVTAKRERAGPEYPSESGYSAPKSFTATKTDTPIFDTPANIQVVPREVIDDQKAADLTRSLENVSSVRPQPSLGAFNGFIVRGFQSFFVYRNGLRQEFSDFDTANLESIEVLKGPAAILYGRVDPGGVINLATKQALPTPYYSLEQQFGSFDLFRTLWDASGSITPDKTLSYRVTGAYTNGGSFRDFHPIEQYQLHAAAAWRPSAKTHLSFDVEVFNKDFQVDYGVPAIGTRPAPIPVTRFLQEPGSPTDNISKVNIGFNLSHQFHENWALRNRFLATFDDNGNFDVTPSPQFDASALQPDNRTLSRNLFFQTAQTETYTTNLDLLGKLNLWGIRHEVLLGFDYYRRFQDYRFRGDFNAGDPALSIDIFNPVYGATPIVYREDLLPFPGFQKAQDEWYGAYFQDHITLWDKLHILGGGRYDWATTGRSPSSASFAQAEAARPERRDENFSPRVGVLYQPWPWLGVYGNYTESFGANTGVSASGRGLPPETGTQYEVGLKTQFFDQRLIATLAFYHLSKNNILTPDLSTPAIGDSTTIGEARSKGIEFDFSGQITRGLKLIGNYALMDARITRDFSEDELGNPGTGNQGNRLPNAPRHSGSVWMKYDFAEAPVQPAWRGLSLGMGVFAASERAGDNENSFALPGYARLDASAAYRWKVGPSRITAQLNVRNILDKHYYEATDPFVNLVPRLGIIPGAPLTFIGSLRVEF